MNRLNSSADDGRIKWIRAIGFPFFDESGRAIHFDGVTIDVTAKRQAEETTGLLAAILASSDDAIVSKNLNGVITRWNKGAERLFGYTAQDAIGQHITLIIPRNRLKEEHEKKQWEQLRELSRRLLRTQEEERRHTARELHDGADQTLTVLGLPLESSPSPTGATTAPRDPHGFVPIASADAR